MPANAQGNKVFVAVKGFKRVNEFQSPESLEDSELTVLENATLDRVGGDVCARNGFNLYNSESIDNFRSGSLALAIPKQEFNMVGSTKVFTGTLALTIPKQTLIASSNNPLIDLYAASNRDNFIPFVYDGMQVGMSFTGDGRPLLSWYWLICKRSSAVGSCRTKIYAHSGTFDTGSKSSLPTGSALATSQDVDISTLIAGGLFDPPTLALEEFFFNTPITPVLGTHYVATLEVTNANIGGGVVDIGIDSSSVPSGVGNTVTYEQGTWAYNSTEATIFYAYNTQWYSVTSDLSIHKQTFVMSGNYTAPTSTYNGSLALSIHKQTFVMSGAYTASSNRTGTMALTISKQTFVMSGTYTDPVPSITAWTIKKQLLSATGVYTP